MWLSLALLCALLVGTGDILSKIALQKSREGVVGLSRLLFALPILGGVAWVRGIPTLRGPFWWTLLGMIPFELSAYLLYLRAIRIAPLSLTVPFLALTPVFTIVSSWILLGEKVSFIGALGIFAVTAGAYLLHLDRTREGWLAPVLSLFRERGSRFMIFAAFLYSITSNLGKRAIQLSNPFAFAFLYQLIVAFALFILLWRGSSSTRVLGREILSQWKVYSLLGSVMAFAFLAHCLGIAQAPVPYFIAIKRTSLIVGVVFGGVLFQEKKMGQRVVATALMVLGVAFIALFP